MNAPIRDSTSRQSMQKKIRVLVVDDSKMFNQVVCDAINASQHMEVAGAAFDGQQALELAAELAPDIVTLDVHMPIMDGIETLTRLLEQTPTPVIMVSSLTERGADTTLQALEIGALDYIPKPTGNRESRLQFHDRLQHKLRAMAGADVRRVLRCREQRKKLASAKSQSPKNSNSHTVIPIPEGYQSSCIVIGISTGGPPALTQLLGELRPPLPPIVIVQHMPKNFTAPFSRRLDSNSELSVCEAQSGMELLPNHVFVAPGGRHLSLSKIGKRVSTRVWDGDLVSGHRPSVDVLMTDVAKVFGDRSLGVIMTGMGKDGVDGCGAICLGGGSVIGQDESTSDVYGMNKAAFNAGHVQRQYSLPHLPRAITEQAKKFAIKGVSV